MCVDKRDMNFSPLFVTVARSKRTEIGALQARTRNHDGTVDAKCRRDVGGGHLNQMGGALLRLFEEVTLVISRGKEPTLRLQQETKKALRLQ